MPPSKVSNRGVEAAMWFVRFFVHRSRPFYVFGSSFEWTLLFNPSFDSNDDYTCWRRFAERKNSCCINKPFSLSRLIGRWRIRVTSKNTPETYVENREVFLWKTNTSLNVISSSAFYVQRSLGLRKPTSILWVVNEPIRKTFSVRMCKVKKGSGARRRDSRIVNRDLTYYTLKGASNYAMAQSGVTCWKKSIIGHYFNKLQTNWTLIGLAFKPLFGQKRILKCQANIAHFKMSTHR